VERNGEGTIRGRPVSTLEWLECMACRAASPVGTLQGSCRCGGMLYARYRLEEASRTLDRETVASRPPTLWRYGEVLPGSEEPVSLGEGMSPLLAARFAGQWAGIPGLYIKDESLNPTGSFKARGMATALTMARRFGVKRVALASAGNAGSAAAAYGAAVGIGVDLFLPSDTPEPFRLEAAAYGARVRLVPGDLSHCRRRMREDPDSSTWFDLSTHCEPYRLEGKKTMGYELAEQLGWTLPDAIVYPTGGGTGLLALWKAFEELEELGLVPAGRRPKLIAVQAAGCAPLVRAFAAGRGDTEPWEDPRTSALGLRVPVLRAGRLLLQVLRESGGTAVAVEEPEIAEAQIELARGEGIFACPEGAASYAAAKKLAREGYFRPSDRVVLFNTGTGLKYPAPAGLRVP